MVKHEAVLLNVFLLFDTSWPLRNLFATVERADFPLGSSRYIRLVVQSAVSTFFGIGHPSLLYLTFWQHHEGQAT